MLIILSLIVLVSVLILALIPHFATKIPTKGINEYLENSLKLGVTKREFLHSIESYGIRAIIEEDVFSIKKLKQSDPTFARTKEKTREIWSIIVDRKPGNFFEFGMGERQRRAKLFFDQNDRLIRIEYEWSQPSVY